MLINYIQMIKLRIFWKANSNTSQIFKNIYEIESDTYKNVTFVNGKINYQFHKKQRIYHSLFQIKNGLEDINIDINY
jgi:hypothetical protein